MARPSPNPSRSPLAALLGTTSTGWVGALSAASLAVTVAWTVRYRGGFGAADKPRFNWHPVLMVAALVVCAPNAALSVRRWGWRRTASKPAHAYANLAAVATAGAGLYPVFAFHAERDIPDLYSLHSWIGLATLCLMAAQWLLGYAAFYSSGASPALRTAFVPAHASFGVLLLVGVAAAVATGFTEKLGFEGVCSPVVTADCRVGNAAAVLALATVACAVWGLTHRTTASASSAATAALDSALDSAPPASGSPDESSALLPPRLGGGAFAVDPAPAAASSGSSGGAADAA